MPTLIPMTEADYLAYVAEAIPSYAAEKVAAGQWTAEESIERSKQSLDELLPQGLATPDHHLFTVHDPQASAVGMLWIAAQLRAGQRIAYVYDVLIKPAHQRKGFASRAFLALEDEVRSLGLSGIALHVFGHNAAAQALYAKLGYVPTNINMFKPIASGNAPPSPAAPTDPLGAYVALWSEPDPARRAGLLQACWTEDSEIVGPQYRFKGMQAVSDEAARFLSEPSGHRAVRTSAFDRHGHWVRFTIALVDAQGALLHEGWDIVELRPDGKIARVVTFWGRLPSAA